MKLKPYPEYKSSCVEWFGSIPNDWSTSRLKYVASIIMGQSPSSEDCNQQGIGFPFLQGCAEFGTKNPTPKNFCEVATKYSNPGDLLFSVRAPVGSVNYSDQKYGIGRGLCSIRGKSISHDFLTWSLEYNKNQLNAICTGTTYEAVTISEVSNIDIAIPSFDKQLLISNFLDRETAKLDTLIAKQEKLIELLQEKRQAIISHAVTKGLDPKVKMKDSGVEWLGMVPEHWKVRKISNLCTKITNGYVGPTRDILVENGVRYIQSLHIKGNKIKFNTPYFVSKDWSEQHSKSILEAGDVLIVQTGDIGQAAEVSEEFVGCNCHALIIVSPQKEHLVGSWLSWVLNSTYGYHSLLSIQTGAMHPHLNCGNLKDLFITVPPLDEQKTIVEKIVKQNLLFDTLIEKAQLSIGLAKEHRTALISSAVTGKIDVREYS